jgi:hypothetical protein
MFKLLARQAIEHHDSDVFGVLVEVQDQMAHPMDHRGGLARAGDGQDAGMMTQRVMDDAFLFFGQFVIHRSSLLWKK